METNRKSIFVTKKRQVLGDLRYSNTTRCVLGAMVHTCNPGATDVEVKRQEFKGTVGYVLSSRPA